MDAILNVLTSPTANSLADAPNIGTSTGLAREKKILSPEEKAKLRRNRLIGLCVSGILSIICSVLAVVLYKDGVSANGGKGVSSDSQAPPTKFSKKAQTYMREALAFGAIAIICFVVFAGYGITLIGTLFND